MEIPMLKKLLGNNVYFVQLTSNTKESVFNELASQLYQEGKILDLQKFNDDILQREKLSSTFMENLIAIPHAKSPWVKEVSLCIGVSGNNISNNEVNSMDARVFFMIAVPKDVADKHLEIISGLAQKLVDENFCAKLQNAKSLDNILNLFNDEEADINKNTQISAKQSNANNGDSNSYDIVAITACPTGVAHTYIASEKLMQVAKENNFNIKVQTNGSIGIRNELSDEDIKNAKVVLIASDIEVDLSKFNGKPLLKVPVAMAVNKTHDLINQALLNKNIYLLNNSSTDKSNTMQNTIKQNNNIFGFYKHLLNGVSFMIPFVVAGGALIAGAIAFSGIEVGSGVVITNPILKAMEELGVLAFGLMVPILAGYTGYSIAGRPGLAPAMIGGMLANNIKAGFLGGILVGLVVGYFVKWLVSLKLPKSIDTIMPILIIPVLGTICAGLLMYGVGHYISSFMVLMTETLQNMQGSSAVLLAIILGLMISFDMGGPVNKVAMLFGTSMIAAGVPTIMGPIAVAICTPPLGLALAVALAPKKYGVDEKQAGKASFIMGLIGITEGAIPFAAADPLRVIPAIMVGSATSAAIAGYFKVAGYAPHGGPIVLPVVDGKLAFIFAICVGSLVCALMVNLLKKNKV